MDQRGEARRTRRWLRACYWTGALLDLGAAVQMLWPALFGRMYRLPGFQPGAPWRYAMGMGASLMLGWTVLLLWADRAPFARKGVIALTILPVVLGLALNEVLALRDGFLGAAALAPVLAAQLVLSAAFGWIYLRARRVELWTGDPRLLE
jgi:hypothetical protein